MLLGCTYLFLVGNFCLSPNHFKSLCLLVFLWLPHPLAHPSSEAKGPKSLLAKHLCQRQLRRALPRRVFHVRCGAHLRIVQLIKKKFLPVKISFRYLNITLFRCFFVRSWILTSLGTELPFHMDASTFAFKLSCTYQYLRGRTCLYKSVRFPSFVISPYTSDMTTVLLWTFLSLKLLCAFTDLPSGPRQTALAAPPIEAPRWLAPNVQRSSPRQPLRQRRHGASNKCDFKQGSKLHSKKCLQKSFFWYIGSIQNQPLGFSDIMFSRGLLLLVLPVCKFELSFFVIKMRTFNPLRAGEGRGASNPIRDLQNAQGVKWGQILLPV